MVRPRKDRLVTYNPNVCYFKPRGIPMLDLEETHLTIDELEALRLADLVGLSHEAAGQKMGVSRATFGRIIQKARQRVADALIYGKAIKIEGGNYRLVSEERIFTCKSCQHRWEEQKGTGRPKACPMCQHDDFYRISEPP
jgi:predicted DNA-binding protein (UPF0251 family)